MAEGTGVRDVDLPGLQLAPLARHLTAHVPEIGAHNLRAELVAGGRSNLTYLLTDDAGARWVLRRPPLGGVLATAHDMGREYRMLEALHPTRVPVPRPVHLADGEEGTKVLGAPFYLMGYADGVVLRTPEQLRAMPDPKALGEAMMRCLADLHAVDAERVGLGDLGNPSGYLSRQLTRWLQQTGAVGSPRLPAFEQLAHRLAKRLPTTQRTAIVHGDYRLDNVVVSATGEVVAVLDWEMATRGDPLADIGSALIWWDGMAGLDVPVATMPGEVAGYPSRADLLASYSAASGFDVSDLAWYLGFAYFKIAAIFEGIHARHAEGLTVGDGYDRLGPLVPELLDRGTDALA